MKNITLWKILSRKSVFFYLVLLAVAGLFNSCGTRTTWKSRTLFEADTLSISNYFELKQNSGFNDILELHPIDVTKPIIYNGVSYYNASIRFDKSKFENLEIVGKENLSQRVTSSDKEIRETKKTDYSNLYIGLAFAFGSFIILYLVLKSKKII